MKRNTLLFVFTALFALCGLMSAAVLTYTPLLPQTADSSLIIANKAAVSQARMAAGSSYTHITTATTTVIKASTGVLARVVVNTLGAGSILTIYDNTAGSGTVIAVMTTAIQTSQTFDVACATGITVVSSLGTAADLTIVWR
ncbi:MAG: hypothetical protein WCK77_24090 [Verrucomicrobiota bacterium]